MITIQTGPDILWFSGETRGGGKVQLYVWQRVRFDVRDGVLRRCIAVRAGAQRDAGQGRQPVRRDGHRQGHVEQDVYRHHGRRQYRRERRPDRRLFAARHGPRDPQIQGIYVDLRLQ